MYRVVFDVSEWPPTFWWFPLPGLGFVAIGLLMYFFGRRVDFIWHWPLRSRPVWRTAFSLFFLAFAALWTLGSTYAVYGGAFSARRTLQDGTAMVVEGPVKDFVPMPYGGHPMESFSVRGVRFQYSDYVGTPGFNHSASHGGPMREGLNVRIRYSGPPEKAVILKLEIQE